MADLIADSEYIRTKFRDVFTRNEEFMFLNFEK